MRNFTPRRSGHQTVSAVHFVSGIHTAPACQAPERRPDPDAAACGASSCGPADPARCRAGTFAFGSRPAPRAAAWRATADSRSGWRRQISSTFAPASCSFSTPMIFSSLNSLCFMGLPPSSIQKWKIPVRNGPDLGEKVKVNKHCASKKVACLNAATSFSSRSILSSLRWLRASEAISIAFRSGRSSAVAARSASPAVSRLDKSHRQQRHA